MTGLATMSEADVVRHQLALGLRYIDASTGGPVQSRLSALLETVGARRTSLLLGSKADGGVLRFTRSVGALFKGAPNGVVPATILVSPLQPPNAAIPPNRFVIPRRIIVPVALDGDGLPKAGGSAVQHQWVFTVKMHIGAVAPIMAGATGVRGRLVNGAVPDERPVRWGHIVARLPGGQLIGATRTDDRGEFFLRVRGAPGQMPHKLMPITMDLTLCAASPSAVVSGFADVVAETIANPDVSIDMPPVGYLTRAGPQTTVRPGQITDLKTITFLP